MVAVNCLLFGSGLAKGLQLERQSGVQLCSRVCCLDGPAGAASHGQPGEGRRKEPGERSVSLCVPGVFLVVDEAVYILNVCVFA